MLYIIPARDERIRRRGDCIDWLPPGMAPKVSKKRQLPTQDPDGMFHGMNVFLVPEGVQHRRLQVWKHKLSQMGANVEDAILERVTHIFAVDFRALFQHVNMEMLHNFKGSLLNYQWLEECLKSGKRISEDSYVIKSASKDHGELVQFLEMEQPESIDRGFRNDITLPIKRNKIVAQVLKAEDDTNAEAIITALSSSEKSHKYAGDEVLSRESGSDHDGSSSLHHTTDISEESKEVRS